MDSDDPKPYNFRRQKKPRVARQLPNAIREMNNLNQRLYAFLLDSQSEDDPHIQKIIDTPIQRSFEAAPPPPKYQNRPEKWNDEIIKFVFNKPKGRLGIAIYFHGTRTEPICRRCYKEGGMGMSCVKLDEDAELQDCAHCCMHSETCTTLEESIEIEDTEMERQPSQHSQFTRSTNIDNLANFNPFFNTTNSSMLVQSSINTPGNGLANSGSIEGHTRSLADSVHDKLVSLKPDFHTLNHHIQKEMTETIDPGDYDDLRTLQGEIWFLADYITQEVAILSAWDTKYLSHQKTRAVQHLKKLHEKTSRLIQSMQEIRVRILGSEGDVGELLNQIEGIYETVGLRLEKI
jgi:hypothetical protein